MPQASKGWAPELPTSCHQFRTPKHWRQLVLDFWPECFWCSGVSIWWHDVGGSGAEPFDACGIFGKNRPACKLVNDLSTVAILAQGKHRAEAITLAFLQLVGIGWSSQVRVPREPTFATQKNAAPRGIFNFSDFRSCDQKYLVCSN